MFRKTSLAVITAATMLCGTTAFAAPPATGPFGNGTIHFSGTITNSPCAVAPGDDAIEVPFGQVSYRELATTGATTTSQPVVIHLTGCAFDPDTAATDANPVGLMSKANVTFSGTATSDKKGYVSTGSASHVAVQLLKNDNSTVIEANSIPTQADAQQLQTGNNELRFFARLLAMDAVSPGSVDATVNYTLTYL